MMVLPMDGQTVGSTQVCVEVGVLSMHTVINGVRTQCTSVVEGRDRCVEAIRAAVRGAQFSGKALRARQLMEEKASARLVPMSSPEAVAVDALLGIDLG